MASAGSNCASLGVRAYACGLRFDGISNQETRRGFFAAAYRCPDSLVFEPMSANARSLSAALRYSGLGQLSRFPLRSNSAYTRCSRGQGGIAPDSSGDAKLGFGFLECAAAAGWFPSVGQFAQGSARSLADGAHHPYRTNAEPGIDNGARLRAIYAGADSEFRLHGQLSTISPKNQS